MSVFQHAINQWKFNRDRTLETLTAIEETGDSLGVLGWRPGPGRAHIGWQMMHIAITEERFAMMKPVPETSVTRELMDRFKNGSTPDEDIPSLDDIRRVLEETRGHLLATIEQYSEDDLTVVPESLKERGWPLGMVLQVIAWHEVHHQGQAHITFNLWKASQSS